MTDGFLLAYFLDEHDEDGEAVRFAVSRNATPHEWIPLRGGRPVLRSDVGERGMRDPFLLRCGDEVVLLATDLRVWPDQDWGRAIRHGSRGILVARTRDLVAWSEPELVRVAPVAAGNAWAPKAFADPNGGWLVFWASALFDTDDDRTTKQHQRILLARTSDFRTFSRPEIYLDRGRDVIDVTFLQHHGRTYRFSVDQRVPGGASDLGHHPYEEVGSEMLADDFVGLVDDVGKGVLERGEGPAVAAAPDGERWYLLIDEFGLSGYHLFETDDLARGRWSLNDRAVLPAGARHGSLLPITDGERRRLLSVCS